MSATRLLREYWWEFKPLLDPFQVAMTFMQELPHDELLAALRHRMVLVRAALDSFSFALKTPGNEYVPRHIEENLRLMADRYVAELAWAEALIGKVERGEMP